LLVEADASRIQARHLTAWGNFLLCDKRTYAYK
jgi:hypothetical protein